MPDFGIKLLNQPASTIESRILALSSAEGVLDTLHQLSFAIRRASNRNSLVKVPNLYDVDEGFSLVREITEVNDEPDIFLPRVRFEATPGFETFVRRVLQCRWLRWDETVAVDHDQKVYREAMFDRCVSLISIRRRQLAYFRIHQTKLSMPATNGSGPAIHRLKHLSPLNQTDANPLPPSDSEEPDTQQPPFVKFADGAPSDTIGSEFQSMAFALSPSTYAPSSAALSSDPGGLKIAGPFEVPPAPELRTNEKEKICPYCCLVHPAKGFSNHKKSRRWKKHLTV